MDDWISQLDAIIDDQQIPIDETGGLIGLARVLAEYDPLFLFTADPYGHLTAIHGGPEIDWEKAQALAVHVAAWLNEADSAIAFLGVKWGPGYAFGVRILDADNLHIVGGLFRVAPPSADHEKLLVVLEACGQLVCALLRMHQCHRESIARIRQLGAEQDTIKDSLGKSISAVIEEREERSRFLANMSHEIRTPMTAILGFTEVLQDYVVGEAASAELVNVVDTIQRNGKHLLQIIDDILDLSKIEAGKLHVEKIHCRPGQVAAEVLSLMRVQADAKGLDLKLEYDGSIPEYILTDPTRLRQILLNLVGNAIKFTEVGEVRLRIRLRNEVGQSPTLQFDVIDTGIGLAAEQAIQLFQPFTQADTSTTRRFGGSGLGLTISKRLAEMLGGGIAVESTLGHGSTFQVTIATGPLGGERMVERPQMEADVNVASPRANKDFDEPRALSARILLAEDGLDNQKLLSFLLEKAGAEVAIAENGQIAVEQALAAAEQGCPFDLILMDMQMPVLDGYQATTELRRLNYSGPIIALTAHAMLRDREKCLQAGCDDFATKPISRKVLLEIVQRCLGRSAAKA